MITIQVVSNNDAKNELIDKFVRVIHKNRDIQIKRMSDYCWNVCIQEEQIGLEYLELLYAQKLYPLKNFIKLRSYEFDFEILSDVSSKVISFCMKKERELTTARLHLFDTILTDNIERVNELENKVDGINNYLSKSGIIHYEGFMNQFIDLLGQHQLIGNPEHVKKTMFLPKDKQH